jgi:hypothetical protein
MMASEDEAYLDHFLSQLEDLVAASRSVGKPICF